MKVVGLIPSRLESSRLPKKAIQDICGFPMIVHVYKRCQLAKLLDEVYVATDSKKIEDVVNAFEGKVIRLRIERIILKVHDLVLSLLVLFFSCLQIIQEF